MNHGGRLVAAARTGAEHQGLIGPNAVTRAAEALSSLHGEAVRDRIFRAADLAHHLRAPPEAMVPDDDIARLHEALFSELGECAAGQVGWLAGFLTGNYLLAHRIPRIAQFVIHALPVRTGCAVLLGAITRHAWTFAGQGRFSYQLKPEIVLTLAGAPVCRRLQTSHPACHYYAATFESLMRAIVSRAVRVTEAECEATGAPACRFTVDLGTSQRETASWTAGPSRPG